MKIPGWGSLVTQEYKRRARPKVDFAVSLWYDLVPQFLPPQKEASPMSQGCEGEGANRVQSARQSWDHGTSAISGAAVMGQPLHLGEGMYKLRLRIKLGKPRWSQLIFGGMQKCLRVIAS